MLTGIAISGAAARGDDDEWIGFRAAAFSRTCLSPTHTRRACPFSWPAVNSVRYLERQKHITTGFSKERVEQAMLRLGVIFFHGPSPGVRLCLKREFGMVISDN
jgi:hypothetical protein